MSNKNNTTVNEVANEKVATVKKVRTPRKSNTKIAEVQKEEVQIEEVQIEEVQKEPKVVAPKISKFEKVTKEFCAQQNVSEIQLYKYLLKKSIGKKTNLNDLAENLMNDTFFNKDKMLSEILG